jgi:hypothetical protein
MEPQNEVGDRRDFKVSLAGSLIRAKAGHDLAEQ